MMGEENNIFLLLFVNLFGIGADIRELKHTPFSLSSLVKKKSSSDNFSSTLNVGCRFSTAVLGPDDHYILAWEREEKSMKNL